MEQGGRSRAVRAGRVGAGNTTGGALEQGIQQVASEQGIDQGA
jgi:hypothetical protein